MAIHMREHVGSSKLYSWWLGKFSAAVPSYRRLVRGMVVTDAAAIDAAGDRRSAYSTIRTPTLLLGGSLGAAWAKDGLDHLESRLANTSRATIPGQGHNANLFRPAKLSAIIAEYAQRCFPQTG
ncbi:MAG: hypothetical protein LBS56_07535 [Propionibacteriaceae bacterium]|jgi:pimeloyl-ACP methyl ester carboxylesterase|nr:hypothetical protein [Propionibacteriaceae bacterium]